MEAGASPVEEAEREHGALGAWDRAVRQGTKGEYKRSWAMEVSWRSFQKEKRLDKWVKGAERKTGGAHLVEQGRMAPDQGCQCLAAR